MTPSPRSSRSDEAVITVNTGQGRPEQHDSTEMRSHRACLECRRKKTKCDMRRPICGLCRRTGSDCNFPTKRKTPEWRRPPHGKEDPKLYKRRFERLVELLESKMQNGQDPGILASALARPPSERPPDGSESPASAISTSPSNSCPPLDEGPSPSTGSASLPQLDEGQDPSPGPATVPQMPHCPNRISPASANAVTPACLSGSFSFDRANSIVAPSQAINAEAISLDVPHALAGELVALYFDKIQPWLSLLHRPRFYARYMTNDGRSLCTLDGYTVSEALLLYSMFALAARYSSSPELSEVPPLDRGRPFTAAATVIYDKARLVMEEPNLIYLQACILLAFERYTSGPCHRGWILSGICVRIAYDLGLCDTDEVDDSTDENSLEPDEWIQKEEMRRAWWHTWELDMFGSCMSRRPSMIDRRRMAVRLPVSDEAWYSGRPVASATLQRDPTDAWKSLVGCPNQDARAWFIVANYLMALPMDILQGGEPVSQHKSQMLANAIACYSLALPPHLRLNSPSFRFDEASFAQSNWIIGIHIMMVSARAAVEALSSASDAKLDSRITQWKVRGRELSRIIYHWDPEYIGLCQPFVACQLVPIHLRRPRMENSDSNSIEDPDTAEQSDQDLLMLALARHAEAWKLGSILLYLRNILSAPETVRKPDGPVLAKNFAVYFPNPKRAGSLSLSSVSQTDSASHQQQLHQPDQISPPTMQNQTDASPQDIFPSHNHHDQQQVLMDGPPSLDLPTFGAQVPTFGMDRLAPFGDPTASQDGWPLSDAGFMYDTEEALDFLRWNTEWPHTTAG